MKDGVKLMIHQQRTMDELPKVGSQDQSHSGDGFLGEFTHKALFKGDRIFYGGGHYLEVEKRTKTGFRISAPNPSPLGYARVLAWMTPDEIQKVLESRSPIEVKTKTGGEWLTTWENEAATREKALIAAQSAKLAENREVAESLVRSKCIELDKTPEQLAEAGWQLFTHSDLSVTFEQVLGHTRYGGEVL